MNAEQWEDKVGLQERQNKGSSLHVDGLKWHLSFSQSDCTAKLQCNQISRAPSQRGILRTVRSACSCFFSVVTKCSDRGQGLAVAVCLSLWCSPTFSLSLSSLGCWTKISHVSLHKYLPQEKHRDSQQQKIEVRVGGGGWGLRIFSQLSCVQLAFCSFPQHDVNSWT